MHLILLKLEFKMVFEVFKTWKLFVYKKSIKLLIVTFYWCCWWCCRCYLCWYWNKCKLWILLGIDIGEPTFLCTYTCKSFNSIWKLRTNDPRLVKVTVLFSCSIVVKCSAIWKIVTSFCTGINSVMFLWPATYSICRSFGSNNISTRPLPAAITLARF